MGMLGKIVRETIESPLTRKKALQQLKSSGDIITKAFNKTAIKNQADSAKIKELSKQFGNFKRSYYNVKSQLEIMPEKLIGNVKSVSMGVKSKKIKGARGSFSADTGKVEFYTGARKDSVWHEIGVHGTQLKNKDIPEYAKMWTKHKEMVKDKTVHSKTGYKTDPLELQARAVEKKIVNAINFGLTGKALERSFDDLMKRSLKDLGEGWN